MRHLVWTLPIAAGVVLACAKKEGSTDATKLGEADGMKTPESVRYDPERDVFYISNINGNPSQHDNNGFIAILRADSDGAPTKILVEGGKHGVTLDAPKGLALSGDTLVGGRHQPRESIQSKNGRDARRHRPHLAKGHVPQ